MIIAYKSFLTIKVHKESKALNFCYKSTSWDRHSFVRFLFVVNSWSDLVVPLYMLQRTCRNESQDAKCLGWVYSWSQLVDHSGGGGWSQLNCGHAPNRIHTGHVLSNIHNTSLVLLINFNELSVFYKKFMKNSWIYLIFLGSLYLEYWLDVWLELWHK